jgi:hypothetical protein
MQSSRASASRRATLAALAVVTPLGFATRVASGTPQWVAANAGGFFYVIFWILVVLLVRPASTPLRVGLGVLAATCALEFLQLWHPAFLEPIRASFLGGASIGSTFAASDFPWYFAGALAGGWLCRRLQARPR